MFKIFIITLSFMLVGCNIKEEKSPSYDVVKPVSGDKEVVCFVYHRFGDSRYPSTNISLIDFEAHLKYLKTNNFKVLSFSEAIDYLRSDADKVRIAVITIDDAFESFYRNGLPLLKKYDFPATLFINTETVGGNDYMSWQEIIESHNNKIEIGNHTHTHDYFLNLQDKDRYSTFKDDIKQAQMIIEKQLDAVPSVFAYPYGELDPEMKDIVCKLGFKAAAAQNSGVISSATDLMKCPRFPMAEGYADLTKFKVKANMKAFRINEETPTSFILPKNNNRPKLKLTFNYRSLRLNQLQCFIQGAQCDKTLVVNNDSLATLTVSAESSITQRRTLYTLTIPDEHGHWHWFSHLWINPEIK